MEAHIQAGDPVLLVEADGSLHLVRADGDIEKVRGLGVFNPSELVDHPWGQGLNVGQRRVVPLAPAPVDAMRTAERGPQIVQPKDAARIVLECGVGPGTEVLEVGSGSGVLTVALAAAVGPEGRIVSLDHRADHQDLARRNLERIDLADRVTFVEGKAEDPPDLDVFDALVLDVPNAAEAVPALSEHLRVGGTLGAYLPTVRQVEALRAVLAEGPWIGARTLELIERTWHIGDRGSRPDHDMLGHTAFLTFTRRTADGNA